MEPRRSGRGGLDSLPSYLFIHEVVPRLDLQSLCSLSCVSSDLRSAASAALSLLRSLDISEIAADARTVGSILSRCGGFDTLTLNCLRLDKAEIDGFLGPNLRELNLIRGDLLCPLVLVSIAQKCPNLRSVTVEMAESEMGLAGTLAHLLSCCIDLETLCIKIRGIGGYSFPAGRITRWCSKPLESLKLQPMRESEAIHLVKGCSWRMVDGGVAFYRKPPSISTSLQKLSLLLNVISDDLVITIAQELPHLVELDLEDMPVKEPWSSNDLTNRGLQFLATCVRLKSLFLARNRQNFAASFRRVTDMGIFLLSEGCRDLELVRLNGFCKVSDAGFTSILQSCHSLKKFEVRNATLLSDLTFHDLAEAPCTLSELRLRSCNLVTSESVKKLASYNSLELLDLGGCRSIADIGIPSISTLCKLTTLNLAGADITDAGLSMLGQGTSPIKSLSLRGCVSVTDQGIAHLLQSGGRISSTLSTLDLGNVPGVSDFTISTIVESGGGITELCLRSCFHILDSSIEALSKREGSPLRKLDLYNCTGLSHAALGSFRRPSFRGLWWLGVGATRLSKGTSDFLDVFEDRPWLTVCMYGCEMGCHDGWQLHRTPPQDCN